MKPSLNLNDTRLIVTLPPLATGNIPLMDYTLWTTPLIRRNDRE